MYEEVIDVLNEVWMRRYEWGGFLIWYVLVGYVVVGNFIEFS